MKQGSGLRMALSVRFMLVVLALLGSAPVFAVQVDEILPDPALEARARAISQDLRCMVCQNQSIDDSEAPLARDLRLLVRERLKAGDSDGQVVDFMVARYGEFVLLKPRLSWHTAILWGAPLVVLIAGFFTIGFAVRRQVDGGRLPAVAALSEEERRQLKAIEQAQLDSALGGRRT
jgi:cytochrome c-type biogenesis protein CcmH